MGSNRGYADSDDAPARRWPVVLLFVLALAVAFWAFRSTTPRVAKPTAGKEIIAFGDSLVEGVGARPGRDFVSVLSTRLALPIVNAGRRGDTTADARARLEVAVMSRNPRVVVVLLGGNDFLRRVPRADTFANLDAIVTQIRKRGAAVVLVGINFGLFTNYYGAEYEALARRTSAGLVPDVLGGILGNEELMADQIHPNDRGHALMADRIEPVLRAVLE